MNGISALVLLSMFTAADPTAREIELLKTFRREFIQITPGRGEFPKAFQMGGGSPNSQPLHRVEFEYRFEVAKYEVPQNLWEAVMNGNPSRWTGPRNSVEMVSYNEAREFCLKVTLLMRAANLIEESEVVRLPSEAEWEYFARAGSTGTYSFGDDVSQLHRYGWYTGNAKGNDPPVGAKHPNPWGLYDIHGYLWEWCSDSWHEGYDSAPADGSSWHSGGNTDRRVMRGGSWKDAAELLTSSARRGHHLGFRDDAVGLRCVLVDE